VAWLLSNQAHRRLLTCAGAATHRYGHQSEIIGLDCDHRERPITVSRDHTVRLWKVQDETHLVFRGRGSLDCCTVAGQSTWVSGADDGALSLWGTMKKKPLMVSQGAHVATPELGAAAAWVGALAAVRGSDLVASGAADGAVRLWVRLYTVLLPSSLGFSVVLTAAVT
jgi:ribosomal RNA-processing protein 9